MNSIIQKNIESDFISKWIVRMEKAHKAWKDKVSKGSKRKDIEEDKEGNIVESSPKEKKRKRLSVEDD